MREDNASKSDFMIKLNEGDAVMLKTEKIKKEIDLLPADMLDALEQFIKNLKTGKKAVKEKSALLSELADIAVDIDIPADFSKQHDHYLYGKPKR